MDRRKFLRNGSLAGLSLSSLTVPKTESEKATHETINENADFPSRLFIRVRRSYLIAVRHIRTIYGNTIDLGKASIPIGMNYKDAVMELIGRR